MIKQHWAQKVVKKASSIIKSDVLILNRSGYVIATSNSDKIGVFTLLPAILFNEISLSILKKRI